MEKMMAKSSGDDITIPSSPDHIADVDEFVEGWLRKRNVPEDTIADLAIAVTELVNNAIKHGNKGDQTKKVTVSLIFINGGAQATVSDEGEGFDPEVIPNPIAEENLLKEIGRGLFIVKSLMDTVEFAFPATGGTKITISKKIA
jgi:serine/threonine-protein kinase RsbW